MDQVHGSGARLGGDSWTLYEYPYPPVPLPVPQLLPARVRGAMVPVSLTCWALILTPKVPLLIHPSVGGAIWGKHGRQHQESSGQGPCELGGGEGGAAAVGWGPLCCDGKELWEKPKKPILE